MRSSWASPYVSIPQWQSNSHTHLAHTTGSDSSAEHTKYGFQSILAVLCTKFAVLGLSVREKECLANLRKDCLVDNFLSESVVRTAIPPWPTAMHGPTWIALSPICAELTIWLASLSHQTLYLAWYRQKLCLSLKSRHRPVSRFWVPVCEQQQSIYLIIVQVTETWGGSCNRKVTQAACPPVPFPSVLMNTQTGSNILSPHV